MIREKRINLNFDKIKYKLQYVRKGKVIRTEEKEREKDFKKYRYSSHKIGFIAYSTLEKDSHIFGDQESLHLFLENISNNFFLTIYHSGIDKSIGKWIDEWEKELIIIHDIFDGSLEKSSKEYIDEFDRNFEIYKEIEGQEEMGSFTLDEVACEYKGWYCIDFGYGYNKLFTNEEFEKGMKELNVYSLQTFHDSEHLVIFLKDFTKENFLNAIKYRNLLYKLLGKINSRVEKSTDKFFEEVQPLEVMRGNKGLKAKN